MISLPLVTPCAGEKHPEPFQSIERLRPPSTGSATPVM